MDRSPSSVSALAVEAVEWLPSGSDAGLVRVRGRWTDLAQREPDLPALGVRRGGELRRFDSLPDARFGRDPAVWRATYLVPAALMDPAPDELWLSWESGGRAALPAPDRGFEPPSVDPPAAAAAVPEDRGGEVIDRAVLAERRARRAEEAERAQSQRAAEALKAVEVLELRSAELERRLEALQTAEPAAPAEPEVAVAPPAPAPQPEALAAAVATVKGLRAQLAEQRHRVRRSELLRAADAVALATLRAEQARARGLELRLAESERALADAVTAREQAAEQVALARRRAAEDADAVRRQAAESLAAERERAAAAESAVTAARGEAAAAGEELAGTRLRLTERERELTAIGAEVARLRADLERVRTDAAGRAAGLERRLAELDAALAAERSDHAGTASELEAARAQLALAEASIRAESVARTALDDEIDRERLARAAVVEALESARADLAQRGSAETSLRAELESERAARAAATASLRSQVEAERAERAAETRSLRTELDALRAERDERVSVEASLRTDLDAARAERDERVSVEAGLRGELETAREERVALRREHETLRAELAALRDRHVSADAALDAARGRIDELERALAAGRGALADAEQETGGLLARISELERAADDDLGRRAAEQSAAAAGATRQAEAERRTVSADLDAAAAALRARVAPPAPPADAPRTVPAGAYPPSTPVVALAPSIVDAPPVPAAPAAAPAETTPPAASSAPPRPRIVTESRHPARGDVTGESRRAYPWLRGALVKLAHDDPASAVKLVLGLVPAQHAILDTPVEYDLTIREAGTYAISVAGDAATAQRISGPRPRRESAFHVTTDVVTLVEVLAGVEKPMRRWRGPVRVRGRKRGAAALRDQLAATQLDLAAAARFGALLEPDVVFRAFAYAIHPAWTKGHAFTVAQEVLDPAPERWLVVVRDGAPVAVERRESAPPDATVTMSGAAFAHLLRGEPAPRGERPSIRGDRAAVALLHGWTERAQGHLA